MKKYSNKHTNHLARKSKLGNLRKRDKQYFSNNNNTGESDEKLRRVRTLYAPKNVYAPKNFMLKEEYCEKTIRFINRLKTVAKSYLKIIINLDNVEKLGEGAISMLLSVIADLQTGDFDIKGTYPNDLKVRGILERSGFFRYVEGTEVTSKSKNKNIILTKGDYNTPPDEMAQEIRSSMKTVWGTSGRNPLLYGGVFEMIRNSCDHAFRRKESIQWYFSITHNENENFVKFSFVDNGKGIINTLVSGLLRQFINLFKDNNEIIESAFKNGIESRTGLPWRGKGLPTIYELHEERVVKNLVIITNDSYINFDLGVKKNLKHKFSGTYYYWEIDQTCEKYCFT